MASYEWKESYSSKETTTASTTTSSESKCCNTDIVFDKRYVKGVPAFIKLIETLCSLIAYICVEVAAGQCGQPATMGYFKFITIVCFIVTTLLWIFLLFKLEVRLIRCDCCNWVFIEMVYYIVVVVLLFFGDLFISLHGCELGHKAGVVFGWAAFTAFCLDLIYMVYNFCRGKTTTLSSRTTTTTTATVSNPEAGRY